MFLANIRESTHLEGLRILDPMPVGQPMAFSRWWNQSVLLGARIWELFSAQVLTNA